MDSNTSLSAMENTSLDCCVNKPCLECKCTKNCACNGNCKCTKNSVCTAECECPKNCIKNCDNGCNCNKGCIHENCECPGDCKCFKEEKCLELSEDSQAVNDYVCSDDDDDDDGKRNKSCTCNNDCVCKDCECAKNCECTSCCKRNFAEKSKGGKNSVSRKDCKCTNGCICNNDRRCIKGGIDYNRSECADCCKYAEVCNNGKSRGGNEVCKCAVDQTFTKCCDCHYSKECMHTKEKSCELKMDGNMPRKHCNCATHCDKDTKACRCVKICNCANECTYKTVDDCECLHNDKHNQLCICNDVKVCRCNSGEKRNCLKSSACEGNKNNIRKEHCNCSKCVENNCVKSCMHGQGCTCTKDGVHEDSCKCNRDSICECTAKCNCTHDNSCKCVDENCVKSCKHSRDRTHTKDGVYDESSKCNHDSSCKCTEKCCCVQNCLCGNENCACQGTRGSIWISTGKCSCTCTVRHELCTRANDKCIKGNVYCINNCKCSSKTSCVCGIDCTCTEKYCQCYKDHDCKCTNESECKCICKLTNCTNTTSYCCKENSSFRCCDKNDGKKEESSTVQGFKRKLQFGDSLEASLKLCHNCNFLPEPECFKICRCVSVNCKCVPGTTRNDFVDGKKNE